MPKQAMNESQDIPDFKVPNLQRGLEVIEFLVQSQRGFTVSELARELGFPKNSTSRILNALQYYGYIDKDETTREFSLTRKLFSMAYSGGNEKNLMEKSMDIMRQLRDETGETVVISVMDGREGLILEQVQGTHPFRFVCDPGIRQPAHAASSPKVIIAHMGDDLRDSFVAGMEFPKMTATTITSAKRFRAELKEIRLCGYALDRGELLEGVRCASAAILDMHGNPLASITVTGPVNRLSDDELDKVAKSTRDHALRISQRFGYGLQTRNGLSS